MVIGCNCTRKCRLIRCDFLADQSSRRYPPSSGLKLSQERWWEGKLAATIEQIQLGVFKACKFTTNLKLFKACNITTNKCRKSIFPVFLQHLLVVKILLQCKILQWFRNVVNTNICYICCNIFRELDLAIFWKWALQPDVGQVASFPWSWCCGRGLRSFSSQ